MLPAESHGTSTIDSAVSRCRLEAGRPQELLVIAVGIALVGLALAARPEWRGGLATRLLREAGPAVALAYVGVSLVALWHLERVRHVVLFALGENSNQQFFESLARGDVPRWLSPVHVDADLQLFEVRE